jgi:sulfite reductase (NADPH) flavoprotein alpha-component
LTHDPTRLIAAALAVLAYLAFCGLAAWLKRGRRADRSAILVVYASQTGTAEELARASAEALAGAGRAATAVEISDLTREMLRHGAPILFVAATTGDGEAPDAAARFERLVMGREADLDGTSYAVLALGDRRYADFCAFGRRLDAWLEAGGAKRLFPTLEADAGDPATIAEWRRRIAALAGADDLAAWSLPQYDWWRLAERIPLNPDGDGDPAFLLRLEPDGPAPDWAAGDLAEIQDDHPTEGLIHREYSIASIAADGVVELVVRRHIRPDGATGLMSGWLTSAPSHAPVRMRVRANRGFHAAADGAPMILIGAGTGIAGLRAHIRAAAPGQRLWLIFGERTRSRDYLLGREIDALAAGGRLERLDLAFSRDQGEKVYVQDRIDQQAALVREWVEAGAAIFVCGDRERMAPGVDAALVRAVGADRLDALAAAGRYRRDVY